jgi:GT2 family glycosyltransferase
MSLSTVDIVTVNYNSTEYLEAYFAALRGLDYPEGRWRVVMVDNASSDGSRERLPEWGAGVPLEIRPLPTNEGVTGGNNAGIRAGDSEFVALLNPDTRVLPDWLRVMVDRMLREPRVGLVEARQIPAELGKYYDPETGDTSWASTGGVLIRRSALEQVGLFDERFFMYEDDVDLCWRLWLHGWRCVYDTAAAYEHRPHDARRMTPFLWYYTRRNQVFMRYIYGSPSLGWRYLGDVIFNAARSRRKDLVAPTWRITRDTIKALPWMRSRRAQLPAKRSPWVALFERPYAPRTVGA